MLDDLIEDRKNKLESYKKKNNPFPSEVTRDYPISEVLNSFSDLEEEEDFYIVGRILGIRDQGQIIFADINDGTEEIQLVLKSEETEDFKLIKENWDKGDFVEVKGSAFKTNRGEESILTEKIRIVSKSLRPWPSSWYGLEDKEKRMRRRYMDFVLNEGARKKIETRFQITSQLRSILEEDDFKEVETPILQPVPGGATARPFKTHFNAIDRDVYLRVAPELYLKRLLVGGFNKIFEIGKDFRNEGIDSDHYPEFTMLELYWAYEDYESLMDKTEEWLKEMASNMGFEQFEFQGDKIDFTQDWPRVEFKELIKKHRPEKMDKLQTPEIDDVLKEIRPQLKEPVFIINHPKEISPLAKEIEGNPEFVERFQLIAGGTEIVNGFSELNDPIEQRKRMEAQEELRKSEGLEEISRMDEDFLKALEYGMPPAAGLGIGIERLTAFLTDTNSIKEVIPFTALREKQDD